MIAADAQLLKREEEAALIDRLIPRLVKALAKRSLYRWQVWQHFAEEEGLSAPQAVALIERAKKDHWILELNGRLFPAGYNEDIFDA